MKILILITFISSLYIPAISGGHKNDRQENFEEIKLRKIDYLNKKIACVKASTKFREMKKCWKKK